MDWRALPNSKVRIEQVIECVPLEFAGIFESLRVPDFEFAFERRIYSAERVLYRFIGKMDPRYRGFVDVTLRPKNRALLQVIADDINWAHVEPLWPALRADLERYGVIDGGADTSQPEQSTLGTLVIAGAEKGGTILEQSDPKEEAPGLEQRTRGSLPVNVRLQRKPPGAKPDEDNEKAYMMLVEEGKTDEAYQAAFDWWCEERKTPQDKAARDAFKKAMKRAEARHNR